MQESDVYRYSERAEIDRQIAEMRERIIDERRGQIGRQAAFEESIEVTIDWYHAQYQRIEDEVAAQWGIDA